ncbi:MAG: RNA pseudouridine synthase, partial [Zetaproteobacteria bacterium CG_4_9_14_3_um_filter_53_7]
MNYFSAGSAIHELMTCFPVTPAPDSIPSVMPSPFSNTPHPLAKQASLMLMQRLTTQTGWPRDFFAPGGGKMFGVLVVRAIDGTTGYLSAFSGMINGKWHLPGFVPELFNLAEHQSFLSAGNDQLALLTEQLQNLETSAQRYDMTQQLTLLQQQRDVALAEIKQRHRLAKATRKQQRQIVLLITDTAEREAEMAALALASQHHKREATNAMLHWQEKLQVVQQQLDLFEQQISQIKELRTEKSRQLHKSFFATYVLHNHLHEQQPITDFFEGLPPAGAGDCAGPKLLHHAHQHRLQPLALAEFWWGSPPSSGIRHHGQFYPACRGKCRPI